MHRFVSGLPRRFQPGDLAQIGEVDLVLDVLGGEVLDRSAALVRAVPAEFARRTRGKTVLRVTEGD
ncbi:hypothetical protein [Amycolatopsis eburnea]|uniref:Uncharacterized protein n=1 Tax=Amycolatopsis eburnea TaxID=2267691 RepID=A0A427T714_9PSEU|nr:hypothetical protein [Amycolatopsis eburnea]RSD15442.1 hypothetical protein EIY87_24025 [Amycolatopsis eburnea]